MPTRSDSAAEAPLRDGRRPPPGSRTAVAALAALLLLGSCVITDDDDLYTSVVVRFDEGGFTAVISLDRQVRLPLDEDDAYYVMTQCSCTCRGDLVRVRDYWQYPAYPDGSGCSIRIHAYTGDVECFPY